MSLGWWLVSPGLKRLLNWGRLNWPPAQEQGPLPGPGSMIDLGQGAVLRLGLELGRLS